MGVGTRYMGRINQPLTNEAARKLMALDVQDKEILTYEKLDEWLLMKYAKEGWRILDTHLGSGSSRIAAYNLGFEFVGCEIEPTYFQLQEQRFAEHTAQVRMW